MGLHGVLGRLSYGLCMHIERRKRKWNLIGLVGCWVGDGNVRYFSVFVNAL
jgi:hypothetical protein